MAEADENLTSNLIITARPESKGGKWSHPLLELTLARMREFLRQPEAVFWVFGFPLLLAFSLGIAFRNTAPEKSQIAVDGAAGNAAEIAAALSRSKDLQAVVMTSAEAAQALRTGKVALVVRATAAPGATDASNAASSPGFEYHFDAARPDSLCGPDRERHCRRYRNGQVLQHAAQGRTVRARSDRDGDT